MIHYLIDAHNIIHNDPHLRTLIKRSIDHARNSLIQLLHNYVEKYPKHQFTLVFDGNSNDVYSTAANVYIFFSGTKKADKIIKEIIEAEHYLNELIVVSTDREIFNFARLHSCQAMESSDFLFNLQSLSSKSYQNDDYYYKNNEYQKYSSKSSENEINDWLKIFGEEKKDIRRTEIINEASKAKELKEHFENLTFKNVSSNKSKKDISDFKEELSDEEIKDMMHIFNIGKK